MTTVDWLWLLHPALAVALIYPLLGAVLHLALQTRRRRLGLSKGPVTAGSEHTALGRWLTAGVVAIQLIAYTVVILTKEPSQLNPQRSALLQASQRADAAPRLPPSSERTRCHTRYTRCPGGRMARCAPPPQQNHAVSAMRTHSTFCVAAARGRGGEASYVE